MNKKALTAEGEQDIQQRKQAKAAFAETRTKEMHIAVKNIEGDGVDVPLIQLEMMVFSDMANLEAIRNLVGRTCEEAKITDLDEKWVWQMELVLNEAAVNIIKHAYRLRQDGRIKVESEVFMDKVVFYLHHWGEDFERDAIPSPLFNGEQESGYGLFIIDSYADEAIYSTDESGRKSVCLIKNRV